MPKNNLQSSDKSKKSKTISLRVSEDDYNTILTNAKGRSISQYVLSRALDPVDSVSVPEINLPPELIKISLAVEATKKKYPREKGVVEIEKVVSERWHSLYE